MSRRCFAPGAEVQTEIEPDTSFLVLPRAKEFPSTVVICHVLPPQVASLRSPLLESLYAITGWPRNVVVARFLASALGSIIVLLHDSWGMTTLLVAAGEVPSALVAVTVNVYLFPSTKCGIVTGELAAVTSKPV